MSDPSSSTPLQASAWLLDVDDTLLDTAAAMRAAAPAAIAALVGNIDTHDANRLGEAYCEDAGDAFGRYARAEVSLNRSRGERLLAAYRACDLEPGDASDDLEIWGGKFEACFAPRFLEHQKVFKDVEPALARALSLGIRVGLLTNASESLTRAKLRATPLRTFPFVCVVTRDTLGFGKPDRRVFTHAAHSLAPDSPLDRVLYVGDSLEVDVRPASEAGLRGVLVERTKPARGRAKRSGGAQCTEPDAPVVRTLSDLFAL